jgi:Arc/MetJ-type ribon-helix-helix transcriptional regulator
MTLENTGTYVGSKVPNTLKHSIERAVEIGSYLNLSDFVRDAIKEKLQREGFFSLQKDGSKE